MKEQELETLRQIEANKTALAAIGPRKRKFDDLVSINIIMKCLYSAHDK